MGMASRAAAKGTEKTAGTRPAPRGDAGPVGGQIIIPGAAPSAPAGPIVIDQTSHHAPHVQGANSGEVKQYSDSAPVVEEGFQRSIEHSAMVGKNIEKRNKAESRSIYLCPFCKKQFDVEPSVASKKECAAHIKLEHAIAVTAAKLSNKENGDKEGYIKVEFTPREKKIAPLLNPADFVAPEHKRFYNAVNESRTHSKDIRDRQIGLRHGALAGKFNVTQYLTQTESTCIAGLTKLSFEQLGAVARMADVRGKRLLVRAARKAILARPESTAK